MKGKKKRLSLLLAFCLVLVLFPMTALAANGAILTEDGGELAAGQYYLEDNLTLKNDLIIPANTEVTLDLNGFTLTGTGSGSVITVEGTLILEDGSGANSGKLTGGNAEYGGGIYVGEKGKVTMSGGSISGNSATNRGGGVYLKMRDAIFEMDGGLITDNSAPIGAGVHMDWYTEFTMTNGEVSNNTASIRGGGFYVDVSSTLTMSGGRILENTAQSSEGGGVYMSNGDFTMSGSAAITGNKAGGHGGGVYVPGAADFIMESGEISGNTAKGSGGGIYINLNNNADLVELATGKITGNQSESDGGGIYIFIGSVQMSGGLVISDNTAKGSASNFYSGGLPNKIVLGDGMAAGAKIGIKTSQFYQPTKDTPVQISATEDTTNYYESAVQYITSDEGHGVRTNANGYLELFFQHRHSWSNEWSGNGTHHWHECTASDCTVGDNSQKDGYAPHAYDQKVADEDYLASDATCTSPAQYYYSCACGKAGTATFTSGQLASHSMVYYPAKAATCEQGGTVEYWHCSQCNQNFGDREGSQKISRIEISPLRHAIIEVPPKEATATQPGNIAYWYCQECGSYFKDKELTQEITKEQTVIAALGEQTDQDQTGQGEADEHVAVPKTNDPRNLGIWIFLLLLSAGGLVGAVILIKRQRV